MRAFLICAMAFWIAGCEIQNSTGYVPTSYEIQQIQLNKDTRSSIQEKFGSPTVIGESDELWYYIASRREYIAFLPTREGLRRILAVRFENDRVAEVTEYDQSIGADVPISRYTTETGGRELTLWQQLRGNIGNFSAENFLASQ